MYDFHTEFFERMDNDTVAFDLHLRKGELNIAATR